MYFSESQGSFQQLTPPQIEDEESSTPATPNWENQLQAKYDEVDRRVGMVNYYKLIIDAKLFNDDNPTARAVEQEMRNFAIERLETLIGLKQAPATPVQNQFTDDEVLILKSVANTASRRKVEPMLNSIATPKPIESPKTAQISTLGGKTEQKSVVTSKVLSPAATNVPEEKKNVAKRGRPAKIQKLPDGVIPMPTGNHFTSISAMKAEEQNLRFGSNVLTDAVIKANE